ncbi:hypothetical protein GEMRC1_003038 [Eukaryota sp. GEM-RC1]
MTFVELEELSAFKFLSDGQLKAQVKRCLNCEHKPCRDACPAHCSPADFITALNNFLPCDFQRAAQLILSANPFGGVCGSICPDKFCQAACTRAQLDCAIDIPAVQASIIHRARTLNALSAPVFTTSASKKVAIIGAGPAGLSAALALAQQGIECDVYEKEAQAGGSLKLIPELRLPAKLVDADIEAIVQHPLVSLTLSTTACPVELASKYDAVVCSSGAANERTLNVPGAEHTVMANDFLRNPSKYFSSNENIIVVGGGAVAVDCAIKSRLANPEASISLVYRRGLNDMPVTHHERQLLLETNSDVVPRSIVTGVDKESKTISTVRVSMGKRGTTGSKVVEGSESKLPADLVIMALGSSPLDIELPQNVYLCGDARTGPTTAVECVAEGKKVAVAIFIVMNITVREGCSQHIPLFNNRPVPLNLTSFGKPLRSPFILSAAPSTDGLEECRYALKAGWAGVVMKTAFHGVPIHIPSEYMAYVDENTYGNCDNVSGRCLSAVVEDIKVLVKEFPDRLIAASTGGSMTGDDDVDRASWQKHTKMLEDAGCHLVEYSLSCPQGSGGDEEKSGNEGSMVSQSASLTRKVIDWVMECSNPNIPKLFKLTGAVTDPMTPVGAAMEVFAKYPNKKGGATLANSFPSLEFIESKQSSNGKYRQARVLLPCPWTRDQLELSASGGAMDYRSTADFMALGATTVQFCTLPTKAGIHCIDELENGFSHYLAARGFKSVEELIGCLLPNPITDFMELTPIKKISLVDNDTCIKCMNCTRCPYMSFTLVDGKLITDPAKCIGCAICSFKCPTDSIAMVDRTEEQLKLTPHMH